MQNLVEGRPAVSEEPGFVEFSRNPLKNYFSSCSHTIPTPTTVRTCSRRLWRRHERNFPEINDEVCEKSRNCKKSIDNQFSEVNAQTSATGWLIG